MDADRTVMTHGALEGHQLAPMDAVTAHEALQITSMATGIAQQALAENDAMFSSGIGLDPTQPGAFIGLAKTFADRLEASGSMLA